MSEESKNGVNSTREKIEEILTMIHSSWNSISEINIATEQQTASMEEISTTANKLGNLAEDLRNLLTRFKV